MTAAAERQRVTASELFPKAALQHMDLMRGVAALAVLASHLRSVFIIDPGDVPSLSVELRGMYLLTGFGHEAVVVFFVLSGFFIGTSVLGAKERDDWSWRSYLLRRFTRLYVVLVPALILTAAIDRAGIHLFGAHNVYGGSLSAPYISWEDARLTSQPSSFLGNLLFLQGIAVAPYGTNGPLWSLGYEFWSYVLFPVLVFTFAARVPVRARVLGTVIASALIVFGSLKFVIWFGVWLLGAAVSRLWRPIASRLTVTRPLVGAGLAAFATVLVLARVAHSRHTEWDCALGVVTALLVLLVLARTRSGGAEGNPRYGEFTTRLAGFSYTLYLIHFPIVVFVSSALVGLQRWQPTPFSLGLVALLGCAITALAYGIAQLTERHTEAVRRKAETLLESIRSRVRSRAPKGA